ncbi:SPW repeat protein [Deinococcus pimensis]|uniref:SPW repeat protein n=1 Tax=Deinococcus pimensis TaxID=309888 RepID=UPI0004B8F135|nr:SPW repeat protein [Deinococcus pimensis]
MKSKWEDWVTLVLGVWLIISPYVLGFTGVARTDAVIVGVVVVLVSVWALFVPTSQGAEWCDLLLGVGLFVAPWVLDFSPNTAADWNAWIVGALLVVLSGAALPDAARLARGQVIR